MDQNFAKQVGRRLQFYRKNAGHKSAVKFANEIGMSSSTYTSFEQGYRMMDLDDAVVICDALDISIQQLVDVGGSI